jgi:hypothetical protein
MKNARQKLCRAFWAFAVRPWRTANRKFPVVDVHHFFF